MAFTYLNEDCFEWMRNQDENSFHAIVTDPPYGVKEFTEKELTKKREGKGGIWRLPPTIGGSVRQPLPRFSVINDDPKEREILYNFFYEWAKLAIRVLVPGGHIFVAGTPLLSDIVSKSMRDAGFERRGEIIRTITTFRGGDRPKGAEIEFNEVSVIPRGLWEPWGLYRKPISEKTISENLRIWGTGGLRRPSPESPFTDLIFSEKTPAAEREIANHPSIKPQSFLRQIVMAALPLGKGIIYDPFAGSGSTLAAAHALGLDAIGTEIDKEFFEMGKKAIPQLAKLKLKDDQMSLFK